MGNTLLLTRIKNKLTLYANNLINSLRPKKLLRTFLYRAYYYRLMGENFPGLHLGSGNTKINNFLNVDTYLFANCDVISGIESLKLKSESVGIIYNSHVLEHTDRNKKVGILKEWYRVLKPGGILYVAVPDLETLFKLYLKNIKNYEPSEESRRIADKVCNIIYGGQVNKYDFHYYGYSFATLNYLLKSIGFKNIEKFDPEKLNLVKTRKDASFASISLNIKATK